jgi:hypothetical protein
MPRALASAAIESKSGPAPTTRARSEGDPLAAKVRSHFEILAEHFGCEEAIPRLIPKTGTIDA